jgi:hypothetical protein
MAAADAKMEPVKGLDEGDANEVLSLKSQEGEVFRTSLALPPLLLDCADLLLPQTAQLDGTCGCYVV